MRSPEREGQPLLSRLHRRSQDAVVSSLLYGTREQFFRRLPPVGPSKELPVELKSRIRTPREVLRGEEQEFGEVSGTEDVRLPDSSPSRGKKIAKKIASIVWDPMFWATTYPIRGRFWSKINNFYDHPEGKFQKHAFKWALQHAMGEYMPGSKQQAEQEPVADLTVGKMLQLAKNNRLYRQSLVYAASLVTPLIGPIISLVGLNLGNTFRSFKNGEYRKGVGYAFLTVADIAPFAISAVLIPLFGLSLGSAGATLALNIAATFTPTNTFLNEHYQNAYTDAYIHGLFATAEHFVADSSDTSKKQALYEAINEFAAVQARKRGFDSPELFKDALLANIRQAIMQLRGSSEGEETVGRIDQARTKYQEVAASINARRHPSEGEKKKRVPFSMRANKIYFEREVIHLEKKLASLEQIEHIISQAA